MKWLMVRHAICMSKTRTGDKFWAEKFKGQDHLRDVGINRSIIFN
jgi:hypothetical protein